MHFNYDFWYQPGQNVMVNSEFTAPNIYKDGFKVSDMLEGKYGKGLCFWNWEERTFIKHFDLGDDGRIPLEVRFLHDPKSSHGYVATTIGSSVWHWYRDKDEKWQIENVIKVKSIEKEGWQIPVPSFISDLLVSLDDRFLYLACWFHGEIRQYDIKVPNEPRLVGIVWCGAGLVHLSNKVRTKRIEFQNLEGGPQMIQLSLDGKRLYVTNSLLSSWDDEFYPKIAKKGSHMLRINVDIEKGGLEIDENFLIKFSDINGTRYRAHEMSYPGGDCTSDIWI